MSTEQNHPPLIKGCPIHPAWSGGPSDCPWCLTAHAKPHRCPICFGKGIVANGFYSNTEAVWTSSSTEPEQCRSCGGTGIVWGLKSTD